MISALQTLWDGNKAGEYEFVLAGFLTEFASDLRMHDLEYLVSCIRDDAEPSLCAIVRSASELHFKPGHLTFAWNANAHIDWHGGSYVSLDLEFTCVEMTAFFTLWLEGGRAAVEVKQITAWSNCREIPSLEQFERWISSYKISTSDFS